MAGCAGDGWLASAYNTTPEAFTAALEVLGGELESQQRPSGDFPNALVTMWAWITGSRSEAGRVLTEIVAPLVRRDPAELRGRICVGSAGKCAELLSRYARAGCQRVHCWPVGDERRQIELIAGEVMPQVSCLAWRGLATDRWRFGLPEEGLDLGRGPVRRPHAGGCRTENSQP